MSKIIDTSDLSKLSRDDLTYLVERGRISAADVPEKEAAAVKAAVAENSGGSPDAGSESLDELSVSRLKKEAGTRKLSKGGTKDDLIARIREHDAAQASSSSDELVEE